MLVLAFWGTIIMQAIFIVPLGIYLSIISLWKEKSSRFGQTVVSKNVRLYLIFRRNRQFLSILSITFFFAKFSSIFQIAFSKFRSSVYNNFWINNIFLLLLFQIFIGYLLDGAILLVLIQSHVSYVMHRVWSISSPKSDRHVVDNVVND